MTTYLHPHAFKATARKEIADLRRRHGEADFKTLRARFRLYELEPDNDALWGWAKRQCEGRAI